MAAPVTNPASPGILEQGLFIPDTVWTQPRASFLEDFTTQERLHCTASPSSVQKTFMSGNSQLGAVTWSIKERFDASLILGTSNNVFRLFEGAQLVEFHTSGGLVWYGEGKLILIEMKETSFSIFGEAGGWDWMSGPYFINDEPISNSNLKLRFWEAGAAFTQRIGFFTPYFGIAVLQSRWKMSSPTHITYRFTQKHTTGPFLGCTLSTSSKVSLNVEWRGWFENSLNVAGEIRF
jgi:hypothetical protein